MSSETIIGSNTSIRGSLSGNEPLRVFGIFEGTIKLEETLIIEESGVIRADSVVDNAEISGVVIGNIEAGTKVTLKASGRMVGNILAPQVIVEDGASYRGHMEMTGKPEQKKKAEVVVPAAKPAARPSFGTRKMSSPFARTSRSPIRRTTAEPAAEPATPKEAKPNTDQKATEKPAKTQKVKAKAKTAKSDKKKTTAKKK